MKKSISKWLHKFLSVSLTLCLIAAFAPMAWAETSSPENIALGNPATASSYESDGRSPAMGNDGDESTMWIANGGEPGNWWQVDLQADYLLTGSSILFENAGVVWKYKIEVSLDGSAWEQVADKTQNTSTDAA